MSIYDEFCAAYDLNAEAPDSTMQHKQYKDGLKLLRVIVGAKETPNSRPVEPGQITSCNQYKHQKEIHRCL